LQATLNGNVNPKGISTSYYFKYGKTTSDELTTPESSAGSGQGSVGASKNVTLEPGTTYHYRIVAHSEGGTVEGSNQEFKTPGPVEAVTSAASSITEEQVVLNGTVNPRGYDAKYYFEYGPSTGYGSKSKPEGEAGSGASAVLASAPIMSLEPGMTYHYRLVASSGGVTSYGEDKTFSSMSTPAPSLAPGGRWDSFYRGSNGALEFWEANGSKWTLQWLGLPGEMVGNPAPIKFSNGEMDVFFRGSNGKLDFWWWNGSKWAPLQWLGAENSVAGDPVPFLTPAGRLDVFYRGSSGALEFWELNGSKWELQWLGSPDATVGDPAPIEFSNGEMDVFFRGSNGKLYFWWWNGSKWALQWLGSENSVASNPAPFITPGGQLDVFFGGNKGALEFWEASGSKWTLQWLGSEGAM